MSSFLALPKQIKQLLAERNDLNKQLLAARQELTKVEGRLQVCVHCIASHFWQTSNVCAYLCVCVTGSSEGEAGLSGSSGLPPQREHGTQSGKGGLRG